MPVRYALAVSGFGYSGETAVAVPTGVQLPLAMLRQSSLIAARFTPGAGSGKASVRFLVGDSVAAWVTPALTLTTRSVVSLTAETLCFGAYGSDEQPVTLSGAVRLWTVELE